MVVVVGRWSCYSEVVVSLGVTVFIKKFLELSFELVSLNLSETLYCMAKFYLINLG